MQWTPGGASDRFVAQIGLAAGRTDAAIDTGAATTLSGTVPPGTYYTRVVAANRCGVSAASNEVAVVVH